MNAASLKMRWIRFISTSTTLALSCAQAFAQEHGSTITTTTTAAETATKALPQQYTTPVFLFVGMIATYTIISLMIGGKRTYFDPYVEPPEEEVKAAPVTPPASEDKV